MLWIATAAAVAAIPPQAGQTTQSVAPRRQAQAIVRILRPAIVQLGVGGGTEAEGATVRERELQQPDGDRQSLKLVEFY